jgi:DeoD family purine-nucleoside phosphorylase
VPAPEPIHLKPAAELAERVLLPGDPHRALAVAQDLLEQPRMFNHQRGLWGYTGEARDGEALTVQATGMGGPSAAIVVEELIALGARKLIRIGTCGALDPCLSFGELVVALEVLAEDGTSAALGAGARLLPDPELTEALAAAARETGRAATGVVVSTDLFYDPREGVAERWRSEGAIAVEMEAATVLQVAARHGAAAACLLAVSDLLAGGGRERISRQELEALGLRLGETAYAALERAATPR